MDTPESLEVWLKMLRANGVSRARLKDGTEIEFAPEAQLVPVQAITPQADDSEETRDAAALHVLFHSSGADPGPIMELKRKAALRG